jgi:hypothetical protein
MRAAANHDPADLPAPVFPKPLNTAAIAPRFFFTLQGTLEVAEGALGSQAGTVCA